MSVLKHKSRSLPPEKCFHCGKHYTDLDIKAGEQLSAKIWKPCLTASEVLHCSNNSGSAKLNIVIESKATSDNDSPRARWQLNKDKL